MAQAHGSGESAATERVATVRAQIRNGTYKIDKDKLTARLVDEELARVVGGKAR
jgi:anti-sigma28 factor (negative regulator of flagellin synthesis)